MWEYYNPNPVANVTGDCSVRAVAKALDMTWEQAYMELSRNGFLMGDVPNANHVIGATLREHGFKRKMLPDECPECFTVEDFCERFNEGTYVVFSQNHVATVIDGTLYDMWDSSGNYPLYYWYRKDEDDA